MKKTKLNLIGVTVGLLASYTMYAQSPGGVSPAAWYRAGSGVYADAGSTPATDNASVQQWNSAIGTFPLSQSNMLFRPIFSNASTLANFNPTMTFDGSNDCMEWLAPTGVNMIDRATGTIYTAGYIDQKKRSGFAGFDATMDFPGMHFFNNYRLLFFTSGGPGYQGLGTGEMAPKMPFTAGSGWANGATYAAATVAFNGINSEYSGSEIYNVNLADSRRNLRIGGDNNWGAFSGQLNEVLVYEDKLTNEQMDRVETYFAVKYGNTYANGTKNYKNSAGTIVWNATTNNGYHSNIAGIANDGALHQKQSWSMNPGKQVLIGVGTLANTNAANAASVPSGEYLIWGDNGAAKAPTVAISGISGINFHFASIWKVQNSGVGTVRVAWVSGMNNLTLIQSSDATIDAGDVATPMTGTVTINGVVYNYADVTLANGSYFTFGANLAAPGGVPGAAVWLKADAGTNVSGITINGWDNFGYTGGTAGQLAKNYTEDSYHALPEFGENVHNFNPAVIDPSVTSNDGSMLLADVWEESAQRDLYSFVLQSQPTAVYTSNLISFTPKKTTWGALEAPYMATNGNNRLWFYWQDVYQSNPVFPNSLTRKNDIPTVNAFYVPEWVSGTQHETFSAMNGATSSHTARTINPILRPFGNHLFIFGDGGANNYSGGKISEIITYDKVLTTTEKLQVNSYLAVKYGITLTNEAGTATSDYLNSSAAVVWNATTNVGYNDNITGIANDEASGLNQKQSQSVNPGMQQVLIGTTGMVDATNTNAANTTSLTNGQYLIVGDNKGARSLSVPVDGVGSVNLRFGAVWKVSNVGTTGTVRVAWPEGVIGIHLIQSNDAVFDGSDTYTDMTSNVITINGVVYNYGDVTLANNSYFTFGGYTTGPGGVPSAAWYRADAAGQQFSDAGITVATDGQAVQQWNEHNGKGFDLLQAAAGWRPVFSNASTLSNFNPTMTFTGSKWMRWTWATGDDDIIDRADGSIYASGYWNSVNNADLAGFGAGNENFPGLHAHAGKLLAYSFGDFDGVSDSSFMAKYYNTIGFGWENAAGATSSQLEAEISMNGFHNTKDNVNNVNTATAYRDFQVGLADYGSIDGQLNEIVVFENKLDAADMNRVETYLAIKYGNTHAAGTKNYTNSTHGVVWNSGNNAGNHKNIAGIARDDNGSLNQKQSWSTNPGQQVLIGTTGLAKTNASNTKGLSNGQYLVWGDNGMAKSPSVAIAGISSVNYRFASIWKAQNTSSVGTVRVAWINGFTNLTLIQSADSIFTSSDVITPMTNTQVVNGVEYAYADVTIADGQYFTFAAYIQAPGGVTNNLSYWYRADKLVNAAGDGSDVTAWTDFTSGITSDQIGNAVLPKYKSGEATYFNFNPGVNFTTIAQKIGNIDVQTLNSLDFDIFTLTKEGMSGGRFFNIGMNNTTFNGTNWDHPGLNADGSIGRRDNVGGAPFLLNPGGISFASGYPSIMYNTFSNIGFSKGLNGAANGTAATHSARGLVTGGHIFGANSGDVTSGDDGGFVGHIGEVVIYGNGNVTAAERNKVETYLAIKYGITLANTNNYTTSQDVVIWNKSVDSLYYYNVAGIGNDFVSAQHQKQSRSQHPNTNGQIIIGLGTIEATNFANANELLDGQFLVWGDNGNTQAMTNVASTYTPFTWAGSTDNGRRMNRVWKVRNTNNVNKDVLIRFPKASVGTTTFSTGDACADYVIIYADDAAFTTNVQVRPLTDNGIDWDALHTFPNGTSYFTYGKVVPFNQGVVHLAEVIETSDIYADACDIGEWRYFRQNADNSLKLLGVSGYTTAELDEFEINIVPEGAFYSDGTNTTRLMPRVSTIVYDNATASSTGKVRIYYSQDELDATLISGAVTNGWFQYDGLADDAISDIYGDGVFDTLKAVSLIPDAYGVEDGVSYVEFYNVDVLNTTFVFLSSTYDASTVLEVKWSYFRADAQHNTSLLKWGTVSESFNKGFEVERSLDGRTWKSIGFVATLAEDGNSLSPLDYTYTDNAPYKGMNFYRLKQVDINGKYEYSEVRTVNFTAESSIVLSPNPTNSVVVISGLSKGNNHIVVTNSIGQQVLNTDINNQSSYSINLARFPAGTYYISIRNESGFVSNHKLVKQ